jgi:hypothetical protein
MPIVKDASITPFYNLANVRVGQISPGATPELSDEGTPPLADQYGRYIVLIDGIANVCVAQTTKYPTRYGFRYPSREGLLGTSADMTALTRVWGFNGANKLEFFHIRLVNSGTGDGVIAVSIPVAGNYGFFSQELYLPFEIGGVVYDTMYYDLSDVPDAIIPSAGTDLRLNFNYLGVTPVTSL